MANQVKAEQSAGYWMDISIAALTVAETQEVLKSLRKFVVMGCKITTHQDYKIKAAIKARNVALSVFGDVNIENEKVEESTELTPDNSDKKLSAISGETDGLELDDSDLDDVESTPAESSAQGDDGDDA